MWNFRYFWLIWNEHWALNASSSLSFATRTKGAEESYRSFDAVRTNKPLSISWSGYHIYPPARRSGSGDGGNNSGQIVDRHKQPAWRQIQWRLTTRGGRTGNWWRNRCKFLHVRGDRGNGKFYYVYKRKLLLWYYIQLVVVTYSGFGVGFKI